MNRQQKTLLAVVLIGLVAVGASVYLFWPGLIPGAYAGATTTSEAETPFGERLIIKLTGGSTTSGAASIWQMSYQDTEQQNVYEVNATYKSQEVVTLEYSLSVTYSSVDTIKNVNTTIVAIDKLDDSQKAYQLANNKALSGASPISDSGSTTPAISTHLTDCGASLTDATVAYKIYCKVTAVGTVSGQTLTAEILLTTFGCLHYVRSSESSQADVTPTVSVASWWDVINDPTVAAFTILAVFVVCVILIGSRKSRTLPSRDGRGRFTRE